MEANSKMSIFTLQPSDLESRGTTRNLPQSKDKSITRRLLERIPSRGLKIYPLLLCALCYVVLIMKAGQETSLARRYNALAQKKLTAVSHMEKNSFTDLIEKLSTHFSSRDGNTKLRFCLNSSQQPVEFPWWAEDRSERPPLDVAKILSETLKETDSVTKNLPPGAHWRPKNCAPRNDIGIIVPYRNRPEQLKSFVDYMHPFLQRQNYAYTIYIVEQGNLNAFNRALLFNIGFAESKKLVGGHDCYYFHDVDLIPENDLNLYDCPKLPRHHCAAIDIHNYGLLYKSLFGGVVSMKAEHFELINGFSNLFYGWGGEDDDFFNRAKRRMEIMRYPKSVASYTMLSHAKQDGNPVRMSVLGKCGKIHKGDGLNSLCYRVKSVDLLPRYTRIVVDFNQTYQYNTNTNLTMKCDNGEPSYDVFQKTLDEIAG